jgi:hypothetical protein
LKSQSEEAVKHEAEKQFFGLLSSAGRNRFIGPYSGEPAPAANSGRAGSVTTARLGRRSGRAIADDIRECSAIWLRRAEELFGDLAMVDDFNHAVRCAKRFEAALRRREKPFVGAVRKAPATRSAAA